MKQRSTAPLVSGSSLAAVGAATTLVATARASALTTQGPPRATKGVQQSLLQLGRLQNRLRQVTHGGHSLYTFVGDGRAGQTTREALNNLGADWYALAAGGQKVEQSQRSSGGYNSGGYGFGGGH
jgi:hypothetical protein